MRPLGLIRLVRLKPTATPVRHDVATDDAPRRLAGRLPGAQPRRQDLQLDRRHRLQRRQVRVLLAFYLGSQSQSADHLPPRLPFADMRRAGTQLRTRGERSRHDQRAVLRLLPEGPEVRFRRACRPEDEGASVVLDTRRQPTTT